MAGRAKKTIELRRRGVRHGRFPEPARGARLDPLDRAFSAECERRWSADRPICLPGALLPMLPGLRGPIARSLRLFERLRGGASFADAVRARLRERADLVPVGATVDTGDEREIEKFYVDALAHGRVAARGLYAKLSWIAHDARDRSLRIRFSFGSERLLDWQRETRRAPWAERLAGALFPECAAIARNRRLVELIERLIGRRARFSERIVYSNAPLGGALFHHDDEAFQLGVVFGQLAGETAWLALPKRELAAHVVAFARAPSLRRRAGTPARALRALEREDDSALRRLIDATPAFTRRLVEHGALQHLRAGDALLLPNHGARGPDDTCWHSVFALGTRPSLAHSYGIFAARRGPGADGERRPRG